MLDYEEYCPVSKAAMVLGEKWTLQIIREMLLGVTRFSEFQKYLPKLSPTLLNSRLKSLEAQGVIIRKKVPEKRGYEYQLTPAGRALKSVVSEMGIWGLRWAFANMNPEQLNMSTIMRDFASALNTGELPGGQSTIQMTVSSSTETKKYFILVRENVAQLCDENIGYDVDVFLSASLETFGKIWFGEISLDYARRKDLLKVAGTPFYEKHLSKWLGISQLAVHHPGTIN